MSGVGVCFVAAFVALAGCGDDDGPGDAGAADAGADAGPIACTRGADCDDGLFCNGAETCSDGRCSAGVPPDCNDGIGCTTDDCSESMRACVYTGPDADGDGHADVACPPKGERLGDDCDDLDPAVHPGAEEVCDAENLDEDCDGTTLGGLDADHDGVESAVCCNADACGADCNDGRASTRPGATETCNGFDDDCDGNVDEEVSIAGFADLDADLHGDPAAPIRACPGASSFSLLSDDCDDGNPAVHRAQVEICDGLDNDCDGTADEEGFSAPWYRDADGDGFGSPASGIRISCAPPPGHSILGTDCDDSTRARSPGAAEICDGLDNDCDGAADFAITAGDTEDDDGDGHPDGACGGGAGDCADRDPRTYADVPEIRDRRDNDCDGRIDEDVVAVPWYADADADGWGADAGAMTSDTPIAGRVTRGGDCADDDPLRHPTVTDDCDGADDDCDTRTDEDAPVRAYYGDDDGDGFPGGAPTIACAPPPGLSDTHTDCEPARASMFPGATETCNLHDDDCDGLTDEGVAGCAAIAQVVVGAGGNTSYAVRSDGQVRCWGYNYLYQCGIDSVLDQRRPVTVRALTDATVVSAGGNHACALRAGGRVSCWGYNRTGALANGTVGGAASSAIEVPAMNVSMVAVGADYTCLLDRDASTVRCAGENSYGQLARGTFDPGGGSLADTVGLPLVGEIGAGNTVTCARSALSTFCWGAGDGVITSGTGDGTTEHRATPVDLGIAASDLYAGPTDYCLRAAGEIQCWGQNAAGELALGDALPRRSPVASPALAGADEIAIGGRHLCARFGGTVRCAGDNASGQLGDGTTTSSTVLVTVVGVDDAVAIAAGADHTCALRALGPVVCWGANNLGQLGDDVTPVASAAPVEVVDLP